MTSYTYLGMDAGQADSTLAIRVPGPRGGKGTVNTLTFSSLVGTGDVDRFLELRAASGGEARLADGEFVFELDGVGYFIGSLALAQSRDATTGRGDPNRYTSGLTLRLMLAAFGQAMDLGWMRNGATIRMVTGTPLEFWSVERRRLIQQLLMHHGEPWTFVFGGKDRTITFDGIGVVPECAATLYATAAEPVHQCAGDIGWGSTELYWAVGRQAVERWSKGKQLGVSNAADEISAQVKRTYGRHLTEQEKRAALRAWKIARDESTLQQLGRPIYPRMSASGKAIDLDAIVPASINKIGEDVVTFFGQVWGDDAGQIAAQAEVAKLIGGGAYFFGDQIKAAIGHMVIPDQPEEANARSYLAIAEAAREEQWLRNRG